MMFWSRTEAAEQTLGFVLGRVAKMSFTQALRGFSVSSRGLDDTSTSTSFICQAYIFWLNVSLKDLTAV